MSFRNTCPMRHENGNCLAVGGFCTAVNDEICQGLHNAYEMGKTSLDIVHCNDCKYEKECENLYSIFCNGYCDLGKKLDKEKKE